jgi:hypothetical protein
MRQSRYILTIACASMAFAVTLSCSRAVGPARPTGPSPSAVAAIPQPPVDLRNYSAVRTKVEKDRIALWSSYQRATTTSEKETIINQARQSFVRSIYDEIFPYWYGTKWDFYGATEAPGEGKIACGYFVSTVLRDLGVKVERTRLAQQASENIILSLTTNDHTKRFRQVPVNNFVDAVRNWGTGLYVVGLDIHVGFILNVDGDIYFIHSSYVDPYCVVKERGLESRILTASRYRVLGKLSEDDDLILKWLRGDQFTTRGL